MQYNVRMAVIKNLTYFIESKAKNDSTNNLIHT